MTIPIAPAPSALFQTDEVRTLLAQIAALPPDDQQALLDGVPAGMKCRAKFIYTERVTVTKAIALQYLTFNDTDIQRKMKELHIKDLAREQARGQWVPDTIIQFGYVGDTRYLIDGQNRLNATARAGEPQDFLVIHRYFDTMDDLKRFFGILDGGIPRTTGDRLKTLFAGENLENAVGDAKLLISALKVNIAGYDQTSARTKRPIAMGRMMPLVRQFDHASHQYLQTIKGKPLFARLKGSPIMAVGVMTFAHMPAVAEKFWAAVAQGGQEASSPHHPAQRLHEFIVGNKVDNVNVNVFSRVVAKAFNHYANKEKIEEPLTPASVDPKLPIRIKGTSFDGKQTVFLTLDGDCVTADKIPVEAEFPAPKRDPKSIRRVLLADDEPASEAQTTLDSILGGEASTHGNESNGGIVSDEYALTDDTDEDVSEPPTSEIQQDSVEAEAELAVAVESDATPGVVELDDVPEVTVEIVDAEVPDIERVPDPSEGVEIES